MTEMDRLKFTVGLLQLALVGLAVLYYWPDVGRMLGSVSVILVVGTIAHHGLSRWTATEVEE